MKLNLNIQPLDTWITATKEPLLIAGPCSAETEDQLVATAHLLKNTGRVTALRIVRSDDGRALEQDSRA